MELTLTSTGSFPRISTTNQQHRTAYAQRDQGALTAEAFEQVQQTVTREILTVQAEAGLDLVTDGLVRWHDPISHFAGRLDGVKINGLLRFFDTNMYFRQPVVVGPLAWRRPVVTVEYQAAAAASRVPVKPILTGPYTLARLSLVETDRYRDMKALVLDYAEAVSREVETLAAAGATTIQIDEPAILQHPQEIGLLREALGRLAAKRGAAALALYTYFGNATPVYDQLQDLPVQMLGLDFTYSPGLADRITQTGSAKPLGLGLLDGRNTRLETPAAVVPVLDKVLRVVTAGPCALNPSCGLEYLPWEKAQAKLAALKTIKALWKSSTNNGGQR